MIKFCNILGTKYICNEEFTCKLPMRTFDFNYTLFNFSGNAYSIAWSDASFTIPFNYYLIGKLDDSEELKRAIGNSTKYKLTEDLIHYDIHIEAKTSDNSTQISSSYITILPLGI